MSTAKKLKLDNNCYPILPDDLLDDVPLTEVYVDTVKDKKTLSATIKSLNSLLPIPELVHLKRVRNKEILLFPVGEVDKNEVHNLLKTKGFNVNLLENQIRTEKVAKTPPKIRKQWEIVSKLWPCNFHPNKYLEKLTTNTMFTGVEQELHKKFMRIAIEISKLNKSKFGCCVIDPKTNSVVAIGYNETCNYPFRHSLFVAIDNVAKTQLPNAKILDGIPEHFLVQLKDKFDCLFGLVKNETDSPYLCTGYVVYCTHEPCIACAMALVHSRIKRIFFGRTSTNGGLGSLCKIHTVTNLNHHYEAFGGLLEDECLLL